MRRVRYEPGTGPSTDAVDLDGPVAAIGTGGGLRGRQWEYTLGFRGISGAVRACREVEATLRVGSPDEAARIRHVFDRDVMAGTPGSIVVDGSWSTRAYVVGSSPSTVYGGHMSSTIKIVLVDGVWRRWRTESFPVHVPQGGSYLDLPYDIPYDLSQGAPTTSLDASEWASAPVRIIVYGPVSAPELTIAGNRYSFDVDVPEGAYLVCDGLERTITLTGPYGDVTDEFPCGERGGGEGSGSYCFERVPAGTSEVSWDNSFGFDVQWAEEEGEPPW